MFGKIANGKLVIAGNTVTDGTNTITNPNREQLIALGYKEVEYTEKPTYNDEEEKLVEKYTEREGVIVAYYDIVNLTTEEHNEIIKRKIVEEENKITERNKLDYMIDKDNEALNRIQQHRSVIVELRAKIRPVEQEAE